MLIICPECQIQVSNKAIICPHCGYPFKPDKISPRKSNRKKRLPNGFGQISFIKGNLRNPYRAMITVGKNEFGKPICKLLQPDAYFRSYNEAYEALMKYHQNPSYFGTSITMATLYDLWIKQHSLNVQNPKTIDNYNACWKYAINLHNMRVRDVRTSDIDRCLMNPDIPSSSMTLLKTVLNLLFDYAVQYEYTDKNYARIYNIPKNLSRHSTDQAHKPFTKNELEMLKEHINDSIYNRLIYVQCYTGFRPSEILNLEIKNIDMENDTIVGGMKTDAGKDRIVPIHSNIKSYISSLIALAKTKKSEYLFSTSKNTPIHYNAYRVKFVEIMKSLNITGNHSPHDPRLTFVTMAKESEVDEYAIKYIVGHVITDITERVYTKRNTDWLKKEMEKIK